MDDAKQFLIDFQDHLAPKLDTYEQAIYLYVFRHSRLLGKDHAIVGFKSARKKMAFGVGQKGTPMSEGVCYEKLRSLEEKGCVERIRTERQGTLLRLMLPSEIAGLIRKETTPFEVDVDELDFFTDPQRRLLILAREEYRCFYCLKTINAQSYVIEHVVSRPAGDSSYRNVVDACRQCNNRKGALAADTFLRGLYRGAFLSQEDFEDRIAQLARLKAGDLKPPTEHGAGGKE